MLSIAEFAKQGDPRDPEAIAATIRQDLQPLGIASLVVEVTIVDSSLDLQIRTNSAIDKEKLLTLLHDKLQNLRIESVAKFRIHCWRNDEEIHEQHLLWTEQFMINSPRPQARPSQQAIAPNNRLAEPRLSKKSVLQDAINKIAPAYPKAKQHLDAIEAPEEEALKKKTIENSDVGRSDQTVQTKANAPTANQPNSSWQFLLVAISIVLLGLGIGASVRALTIKTSNGAIEPPKPQPIASQSDPLKSSTQPRNEVSKQASTKLEASTSIRQSDSAGEITLEKFNVIQMGMKVEEVEKIFGVSGRVIAENNDGKAVGMVYSWKNPEGSNAIIEFKDGQVVAKAQAGL